MSYLILRLELVDILTYYHRTGKYHIKCDTFRSITWHYELDRKKLGHDDKWWWWHRQKKLAQDDDGDDGVKNVFGYVIWDVSHCDEVAAASEYIARASTDTVTQAFSVSKVLNPWKMKV